MSLTREAIEEAVKIWQNRLNLPQWKIMVDWTNIPENSDAGAYIQCTECRDRATIVFAHDILDTSPEKVNIYIAHEVMHLHSIQLYRAVYKMLDKDDAVDKIVLNFIHEEIERITDRVATAFANSTENPLAKENKL